MDIALMLAAALIVAYGLVALALWHYQERIVFQPPRRVAGPDSTGVPRLSFQSSDGTGLFAYMVGESAGGQPPLLVFHGNAEVARELIPWADEVNRRLGLRVILAEYRGYDTLDGTPTYKGSRLDALAVIDATARHLLVDPSEFLLYGHSLGTAVAAELAATGKGRALILEAPFTSARDMVSRWPVVSFQAGWSLVSRVHYDTRSIVRELTIPVHVAHGERDVVIPAWMGRAVHAAARVPGRLLILPHAGHNDVVEVGGAEYWAWLAAATMSGA